MEKINKQRRSFISLSELEYGPLEFNLRWFAYIWQSKKAGIIAIKTGRTQIHFLSDVVVAVASLANEQALAARSRVLARLVSLAPNRRACSQAIASLNLKVPCD